MQTAVFQADDAAYAGTMNMNWHLTAAGEGTEVTVHRHRRTLGIDQRCTRRASRP
ncbi:hypothetical protein QTS76_36895, partial [Micromonospora sp. b486]|nr:hypothetical protein [Micromonospora sp. b486]